MCGGGLDRSWLEVLLSLGLPGVELKHMRCVSCREVFVVQLSLRMFGHCKESRIGTFKWHSGDTSTYKCRAASGGTACGVVLRWHVASARNPALQVYTVGPGGACDALTVRRGPGTSCRSRWPATMGSGVLRCHLTRERAC